MVKSRNHASKKDGSLNVLDYETTAKLKLEDLRLFL